MTLSKPTETTVCQTDALSTDDIQAELIKRVVISIQGQLPSYCFESALAVLNFHFSSRQKGKPKPRAPVMLDEI